MSDIATVRMELGEDSRRRLIADMSAIVEERDELLLAVADYVLATNSLGAAEKAEKLRELVRDMWRDGMCECDERGACAECEYGYLDRMRELGVDA